MNILKSIYNFFRLMGLDLRMFLQFWRHFPFFFIQFLKVNSWGGQWPVKKLFPIFSDMYESAGTASGHYFHQDLYFAKKIYNQQKRNHCDVGSRIDGFIAHLLTFMEVNVIDIREMKNTVSGLNFIQGDLMNESSLPIAQFESVSCLHALEHFGLGRYTDALKMDGYNLGFINLVKLLKDNGVLFFSVPIGRQRIEFNAHRIFSIGTVMSMAEENNLKLIEFAYIDDLGSLVSVDASDFNSFISLSNNLSYGCGLFTFIKNE